MNQQPDQFFRNKLEGFHKPVPASAWQRVEKQLDKKPGKSIWLKIAAGLFFAITASMLYWSTADVQPSQVAINKEMQPRQTPQKESPALKNSEAFTSDQENRKKMPTEIKSTVVKKEQKVESVTETRHTDKLILPQEQHGEAVALIHEDELITETDPIETTPSVVAQEKPATGITIIYSAEEVNQKYLNKKSLADATQENKKPSTMQKLLDKAYDLKHNQDALGELRQKKNEILALNFKTEKTQTQTGDL